MADRTSTRVHASTILEWLDRRRLDSEEREVSLEALAIRCDEHWWRRFGIVMLISVVIAVMGLSMDSPAVVIGAMLIAPLMTPVLALSAALAMGWPKHAATRTLALSVTTAGAIGVAWLLGTLLPRSELTEEVLSRTSPDLRDLVVALAAGFGGAYVTVRRNMAGSLAGVAVAVALVPPLGAVGLSLAEGRNDLAAGAGLLYGANLAAIVLSGLVVFLVTGFVPAKRLSLSWVPVSIGAVVAVMAVGLIALPLARRSGDILRSAQQTEEINRRVSAWLADSGDRTEGVQIDGNNVRIDVVGPNEPPDIADLRPRLTDLLNDDLSLQVRYTEQRNRQSGDKTTVAEEAPQATPRQTPTLIDEKLVAATVDDWLTTSDAPADSFEVLDIGTAADAVTVAVRSSDDLPDTDALSALLEDEIGMPIGVTVGWTRAERPVASTSIVDLTNRIERAARTWTEAQSGDLEVLALDVSESTVVIDVAGDRAPTDASALAETVNDEFGRPVDVEVRFLSRATIPTVAPFTTTTSPPTTAPTNVPTTTADIRGNP